MLYFDAASTTPPTPEALEEYTRVAKEYFGNSSSRHGLGFDASKILERTRNDILSSFGLSSSHRLVFTAGASEANNLALKGVAFGYSNRGKRILSTPIEHPSVKNVLAELSSRFGFVVEYLPVNSSGVLEPSTLKEAMGNDVILVSVMGVNNETGTIEPLKELASIVHAYPKAFFHSDVTQMLGKVMVPYPSLDLFSFSGHKFGAVKGVGGLCFKKSIRLVPQVNGGEQEFGFRAGTSDVPSIASMGKALGIAYSTQAANEKKEKELRDYLRKQLEAIDEVVIHSPIDASPYVLNFSLTKHKASVVVEALSQKGIYVSSVSACSSKGEVHSYVLEAMGKPLRECENPIRVSMLPSTTKEEIDTFVSALATILQEVRPL